MASLRRSIAVLLRNHGTKELGLMGIETWFCSCLEKGKN
jgi:hypothetical protein